ncbi:hypothetical protein MW887_007893 [Aspergillus wentii]|nr:hypothetical protein MW887_007893 [Aspergillus wentii]
MTFDSSTPATANANMTPPNKSHLSEWPGLPAVNDSQTIYVESENGWLQQPCPPELEMLPLKLPTVIAHIIRDSTDKEGHIPHEEVQRASAMVANSAVEEQEPEAPIEQAVENELVDQTPNDVPSKKVLSVLAPETKAIYSSKLDEYETPVADRWYCPEANCGKWIPPKALESESPSQLAVGGGGNLDRNQETELAAVVMAIEYAEREENEERQRREQLQGNEQRSQEQEGIDPRESHRRLEIDERARILGEFLSEINRLQQERLIHRQREEVYVFLSQQKAEGERLDRERRQVMEKHQWSIETRFQRLVAAQKADIQNMELEHKEEEDSLIVRFPRLYRGLPTAEAEYRESAVLAKLRGMQREEKLRLIEDHQQALADNKKETSIERGALESALKMQWRTEQKLVKAALRSLVQTCVYDRFWFDQVVAKREDLLEKYRQDLINSGNGLEDLSFVETRGGEFYPVMQEWI